MKLLAYINEIFLIFLSTQIHGSNAEFPFLFSRFKLFLSDLKTAFTNFFPQFEVLVPSFDKLFSVYSKNFNCSILTADGLVSKLYDNMRISIQSLDDFLTHFIKNSSLWNWSGGFYNSCSNFNSNAYDFMTKHELYGQHIVDFTVSKFLKDHVSKDNPKKPLVMSFHGQTGCGKNLVSKLIAESLFQEGFSSKFVHIYYGSLDFPHVKEKETYRKRLQDEIPLFMHICDKSLFIFDEMDKMTPNVIDVLMPYLYMEKNNAELNSRRSIFIFMSNSGGNKIGQIMYESWLNGVKRESMTLEDFSIHLKEAAYNEPGGLQNSKIVEQNVIDVFVPFLPLEKKHIKQCIIKELILRKLPHNTDIVELIANEFIYHPPEFELYSVCGCKKVSNKIDMYGDVAH